MSNNDNKPDLKAIRQKRGMNQSQFWQPLGVTQSGGSRYESDRNLPKPVESLVTIAYGTPAKFFKELQRLRPDFVKDLAKHKPEVLREHLEPKV